MRPKSIVMFDYLYGASLALGLASFLYYFRDTATQFEGLSELFGGLSVETVMIMIITVSYAVSLLIWYFISRTPSNVAKWILVVLTAMSVTSIPGLFQDLPRSEAIINAILIVLQVAAIAFLFQPDAKEWFESGGPVDPATFE